MISIAHAPIAIREQVSMQDAQKFTMYTVLQEHGIVSCLIISTCNRFEVYGEVEHDSSLFYELMCEQLGEAVVPYISWLKGMDAMKHALRVCAGLTSSILGEDQIFHQMKAAYAHAQAAGMISSCMHRFFQAVFHYTKQLKHTWQLSEQPRSTSYVAWQMIKQKVDIETADFLICGGGDVIQEVLPYMKDCKGYTYLAIRNQEKRTQLQLQFPFLQMIPMEERHHYIEKVQVIISATASPHIMFPVMEHIGTQPLWLFDLALPRDIDEAWSKVPQVHYYNIDQIQATLQEAERIRSTGAKEAEQFVEAHCDKLLQEWCKQEQQPLKALTQQRLLQMAEDTYVLLDHKLNLQPHEQRIMKKTLDYSFTRMMKQMISVIQELDDDEQKVYHRFLKKLQEEEQA